MVEALSSTGSPSHLIVRTDASRNAVYLFSYLDRQDGRKMDSWSKLTFNSVLGGIVGASVVPSGIMLYFLRQANDGVYLVADFLSLRAGLSNNPYLDSQRPYTASGAILPTAGSAYSVAYNNTSSKYLLGVSLPDRAEVIGDTAGLVVGANQEAYFTPTNPYMRDNKNKAILSGSLTITKFIVATAQSGGFSWSVMSEGTERSKGSFNGLVLGDPGTKVGVAPVVDAQVSVPVGLESRAFAVTMTARKWQPLTITAIEWSGQFYNRVQRF